MFRRIHRTANRWRKGMSTLELCLGLSLLVSLTFGAIEFGHFFFLKHCFQGASREGARAGMVSGATNATVNQRVYESLRNSGIIASADAAGCSAKGITVNVSGATALSGQPVVVTVSANWGQIGLRPMGLISASKQVLAATSMRKEG